jgi:hypothetical protein
VSGGKGLGGGLGEGEGGVNGRSELDGRGEKYEERLHDRDYSSLSIVRGLIVPL